MQLGSILVYEGGSRAQLDKAIDYFSAYHFPVLGASPQGGGFHISSSLILLSSVSTM